MSAGSSGPAVRVRRSAGVRVPEVSVRLRIPTNVDPPGGWSGRFFGVKVSGSSAEGMVLGLVEELARLGHMPGGGVDAVLDEVNRVLCSRVGVKCRGDSGGVRTSVRLTGEAAKFSDNVRKVWSPKEYGAAAWTIMHLHPLLQFRAVDFRNMIALVRRMLHPGVSCGCRECWESFEDYVRKSPVGNVNAARSCGEWVWMAHSEVNKRLGRPDVSWADCVDMWGYDASWKQ